MIKRLTTILHIVQCHWQPLSWFLLALITWLSLRAPPEQLMPPGNDKLHHCLAYAALAFPVSLAMPRWLPLYLLGMFFYSGMIEVIQPWFFRQMDAMDLLANTTGLLLGFGCACMLNRTFKLSNPATTSRLSDVC